MTYNIVLVSGIQQNNSVIHISTSIPFFRFFSQIHYYRRLNKVPCAVQYILVDYKPSFFSVWTFSIIFFEVIYNSFISVCPLKLSFQVLCVHSKLGIVEHIIRKKVEKLVILWNFWNPKIVTTQNVPGPHTYP